MQYAYWKVEVMRKHGRVVAARHLVPGLFVLGLPICAGATIILPFPLSLISAAPLTIYAALLAWLGLQVAAEERDVTIGIGAAVAAATMHIGYGLGTLVGLTSRPGRQTRIEKLMTRLTR